MSKILEHKELLDELHLRYNQQEFIAEDPISIPHGFERKEDIEISGFLASTIAWGNRKAIVKSAKRMMEFLDNAPYDFVMNHTHGDMESLLGYVHRTFNGGDLCYFVESLSNIYREHGGMEALFSSSYAKSDDMRVVLSDFWRIFFSLEHPRRVEKHLSSIDKKAACKRVNMYLRWMVRSDDRGVDFGLWRDIPQSALYLPLDVHTGNVSRQLGLLERKQSDWKAVEEVTASLRLLDESDPVKYDFALFGVGINKGL